MTAAVLVVAFALLTLANLRRPRSPRQSFYLGLSVAGLIFTAAIVVADLT